MLDLSEKRITGSTIRLHSADNVAVALSDIAAGETVTGHNVVTRDKVPSG